MIFDLEEKFDIQIPYNANDARMEFETVGEVVQAIKRHIGRG
jgi:acyl carrier protein